MKKLLCMVCVFFITQVVTGQTIDGAKTESPQAWHDDYIKKYKTNKTAGWVLLGSGIGMIMGGGIVYATYGSQGFNGPAPTTAEALFLIVGPAAALVSIPFFISAKRNKTKANLAIKGASVTFGNKTLYNAGYTSLALTIQL